MAAVAWYGGKWGRGMCGHSDASCKSPPTECVTLANSAATTDQSAYIVKIFSRAGGARDSPSRLLLIGGDEKRGGRTRASRPAISGARRAPETNTSTDRQSRDALETT